MEINKIYNEDCLDTMAKMPNGFVDLIVTSPPYNLRNTTGGGIPQNSKVWAGELRNGYSNHSDDMPHDKYVEWQRKCIEEMFRVVSEKGAIFYNHKWRVQDSLLQDRSDIVNGFPVRQVIIWKRPGGVNFNNGYFLPSYEVIYLIAKKGFELNSEKNRYSDVWEFPPDKKTGHPASFPIQLPQTAIKCTDANLIYDPFMGIGSTAIAAHIERRNWIGSEISQEYVDLANKRIEPYLKQLTIF